VKKIGLKKRAEFTKMLNFLAQSSDNPNQGHFTHYRWS